MAINEPAIIDAVSSMKIEGNEEGIIPAFNVLLTLMYTDFYTRMCFEFEREVTKVLPEEIQDVGKILLIDAAVQCGYHTFNGIMNSVEWKALIEPMIEKVDDKIHGLTAVTNALGWGNWQVADLVPGQKLVLRARNSYESENYLRDYGRATEGKCYMLTGVATSFMDLVYGKAFPDGMNTFESKEVKCRAKGDPYCEFVSVPTTAQN
ncbi:MAG: hypothetical protein HYU64_03450 [Armatimonadetes bacterium]|nr:hypothetical protein [Armatimonadota bacterium]